MNCFCPLQNNLEYESSESWEAESLLKIYFHPRFFCKETTEHHALNVILFFFIHAIHIPAVRQPQSFPICTVCFWDIYLSWWHTLVPWHFQLPDLKQQFIRFHHQPHTHLDTLLPILAASHCLKFFWGCFFSLLVAARKNDKEKRNFYWLKFFIFVIVPVCSANPCTDSRSAQLI